MIGFFEFLIAHYLQLALCSARVKHNTAVKTAIDACSLLAKLTFSDLVGKRASSLIINFKDVKKPLLVLNIYFTFFLSVVDCTFSKSNVKSLRILLLWHVRVRSSRPEVFCKKAFLEISQNSQKNTCARVSFLKKRLWHRCFPVNFAKFLRTYVLTEHLRWLVLGFWSESPLYNFRNSCSKQAQYLKFNWTVTSWKYSRLNIVQTSSLCYVAGFWTPLMKMYSAKEV